MKDQRVIVHELSGLPLTPEGYAMRTQCGRAVYDEISAVWWDDYDPRHGLPKRDKFGPHGYRWCRRCQVATATYGHEPKADAIQKIDQTDADILLTVMGKKPLTEETKKMIREDWQSD